MGLHLEEKEEKPAPEGPEPEEEDCNEEDDAGQEEIDTMVESQLEAYLSSEAGSPPPPPSGACAEPKNKKVKDASEPIPSLHHQATLLDHDVSPAETQTLCIDSSPEERAPVPAGQTKPAFVRMPPLSLQSQTPSAISSRFTPEQKAMFLKVCQAKLAGIQGPEVMPKQGVAKYIMHVRRMLKVVIVYDIYMFLVLRAYPCTNIYKYTHIHTCAHIPLYTDVKLRAVAALCGVLQ